MAIEKLLRRYELQYPGKLSQETRTGRLGSGITLEVEAAAHVQRLDRNQRV
jgi:hypothetical protein